MRIYTNVIVITEMIRSTLGSDNGTLTKKLDLTVPELQGIFEGENKSYRDYKNNMALITFGTKVSQMLGIEKRVFR